MLGDITNETQLEAPKGQLGYFKAHPHTQENPDLPTYDNHGGERCHPARRETSVSMLVLKTQKIDSEDTF